jgi:hypothetical protein
MTLIAKPVIDKQFWILQDGNEKVGNIEACAGGYQVKLHNQVAQFKTIRMAAQRVNIEFASVPTVQKNTNSIHNVHGYPAQGRIYNPMWDMQQRLPIYTKTKKSKSWFSAGWYCVKKGRSWTVMQDPKLIVLQRYKYQGPFHTKEEANHDCSSTSIC